MLTNLKTRNEREELLALLSEKENRAQARRYTRDADEVRQRCKRLSGFVREAWPVLEPGQPYVHNWHIDAWCEHLEAVTRGEITRLLGNVPPGTSKSLLTSVMWPAWEWGPAGLPNLRYLATSYNEGPVKRDTRKHRDLTMSEWYQSLWPHVKLVRSGETSFANDRTGTREGIPFGSLTSQRGDRLIIDDPHSTETAESLAERLSTTRRFREGAVNRLNDQAKSAIVVIMQRLHEDDVSGVILKLGMEYVHVCLPMEFEPENRCVTQVGFSDPRSYPGDLLDPIRFPRSEVDKLKRDMGSYAYAGQYQQRPAPREGGLFQRRWFGMVSAPPMGSRWVRAWDLASTSDGDWTAGVLIGRDPEGFFTIADVQRFRGTPADVEAAMVHTADLDRVKFKNVKVRIPEDPGQAGKAQVSYLTRKLAGHQIVVEKESGSKETRASPFAAQCEAGNVRLQEGPWNEAFLAELEVFPMGSYDDQVDAAAGAFNQLVNTGALTVSDELLRRVKQTRRF